MVTKKCSKCNILKPLDKFYNQNGGKHGKTGICKLCESDRQRNKLNIQKYTHCKGCGIEFKKELQNGRRQFCNKKCNHLYRNYNIGIIQFNNLLKSQNYRCKICGSDLTKKRAVVDHCHYTGKIRGILCNNCNAAIGQLSDDTIIIKKAISYLENNNNIKITSIRDVIIPQRAHYDDAGIDFFVPNDFKTKVILPNESCFIPSGIKIIIPVGYTGIFYNKSGIGKKGLIVGAQVIDSSYRGEVHLNLWNVSNNPITINANQKIVQLILQPISLQNFDLVDNTDYGKDNTNRGDGGFGSTGK